MTCCHADFALNDASDKAFTVGMPTFTFGAGCLSEAGEQAREQGLKRVALFTDPQLRGSVHVATVIESLRAAGIEPAIYDEIAVEPTTASFQAAARFASEGGFDGYVSVGGGSVMDTCKAANLYATHPAEFMTYVNAPIGGGQKVPGPVRPHIACPTTAGTGSETTGIAIFNLTEINAKTGIISRRLIPTVALIDPTVTLTLPAMVMAASGFDCMSHALESITARAWPQRLNPARGVSRPVSQGANPFSDALAGEALKAVGKFLVRAVNDAGDVEARTEMMFAATQAGIAFNAAGCHLPHGLSYSVSGLTRDFHLEGYPPARSLVPHGMAVVLNNPSVWRHTAPCSPHRHLHGAICLGADARDARPEDAGEALAGRVIEMMRAAGMPNGLSALGFTNDHIDALAAGSEPQYRVIRNAPKDVSREDLKGLFSAALRYW
ncbi:MAG: iron-containing alcohol dehydrogenase [Pseudomonadota bacterium]|nr:iron-containing alcohol dehydrogenase [Pseudomonadota bacterium]